MAEPRPSPLAIAHSVSSSRLASVVYWPLFVMVILAVAMVSMAVYATGWGYADLVVIPFAVSVAASIVKGGRHRLPEPAGSGGDDAS